jgi:hypothetical protein
MLQSPQHWPFRFLCPEGRTGGQRCGHPCRFLKRVQISLISSSFHNTLKKKSGGMWILRPRGHSGRRYGTGFTGMLCTQEGIPAPALRYFASKEFTLPLQDLFGIPARGISSSRIPSGNVKTDPGTLTDSRNRQRNIMCKYIQGSSRHWTFHPESP